MTNRTLGFALTRPRVLVPGLLGVALLAGHVSLFFGLGFTALALWQLLRLASDPALDDLLRLRRDKERHQIRRLLFPAEREEILALDRYAARLASAGADGTLGQEVMSRAWEIVREAGGEDASTALRVLRHGLPTMSEPQRGATSALASRIDRELDILRAARREVDSLAELDVAELSSSPPPQAERACEASSA